MAENYTVTRQRQTTILDPAGNMQQVVEITAQTPEGVTFHVDQPAAEYSVEKVKAALEAKATTVRAVHQL
jgi:hypothetical protein